MTQRQIDTVLDFVSKVGLASLAVNTFEYIGSDELLLAGTLMKP